MFIDGPIAQPGDQIRFIRKDLAVDGTDSDTSAGLINNDHTHNCAQANSLAVTPEGPQHEQADYGGTIRRECKTTLNGCDPNTCTVDDTAPLAATYHEDCRFASEFRMVGLHDTTHPDRHPWNEITAGAPGAPPWFGTLADSHADNGGTPNTGIAGVGQAGAETYEETGSEKFESNHVHPLPLPSAPLLCVQSLTSTTLPVCDAGTYYMCAFLLTNKKFVHALQSFY